MSVTGFNKRRRELAAQQAAEEAARIEAAQEEQQATEVEAPPALEETQEPAVKNLEDMTYQELRALAKERQVGYYYNMNTEELREALKAGEQE